MQIRGKNMQFPRFETLKTVIFRYATFFRVGGSNLLRIRITSEFDNIKTNISNIFGLRMKY